MQAGEIKVVLTLDNGQFTVQTQKAGQTIQELKKSLDQTAASSQALEKHFTGLYGKFHDTIRTASLLRFALQDINDVFLSFPAAVMKSSGEVERMTKLMQGLSAETDELKRRAEAASNVKFVFGLAQNAPFEVKALTDAFIKLKTAGLDPTDGKLLALTNSIAKFGGTSDVMHRASIAIQQMAGKGVISMEELRQQLGEAMPNAMELMAQGLGMTVAQLSKKVGQGVVDAQQGLAKMLFQAEMQNAGYAKEMMDTWTGQIEKLKTKWELFKVEVGKSGGFESAREELKKIVDAFDTDAAASWANKLGDALAKAIKWLDWAAQMVVKYSDEIGAALTAMVVSKVASLVAPFQTSMGGLVAAFQSARNASRDAMLADEQDSIRAQAATARRLNAEISANEKRIANLNATKSAEHTANAERLQREIEQSYKLINIQQERYLQLEQMQVSFLTKQAIMEEEADRVMRQKKAGSAALAREMQAEAQRYASAAARAGMSAVNAETEIAAINRQIAAKERQIQMERTYAKHVEGSTFAIHGQNAALREQAVAAELAATAQAHVSMTAGTLSGIWGAMKFGLETLWASIKGFSLSLVAMGVQFAAVTLAVEAVIGIWNKIGEAAEKSAQRMRDARKAIEDLNKGFADNKSVEKISADLAVKQARLDNLSKQGGADRDVTFTDENKKEVTKKRSEWVKELREEITQYEEQLERAKGIAQRNNVSELVQGLRAQVENAKDQAGAGFRQRYIELRNAEAAEIEAAGANQVKKEKIVAEYNKKRDELNRQQIDSEKAAIERLQAEKRNNLELVKKGQLKMTDDERKALELGIVEMDKMRLALDTKYEKSKIGFTPVNGASKGEKRDRDPLAELVLMQAGQLEAAKAKLEASIKGVRGVDQLRQEVAFELLGKIAKGDMGKHLHDKDGKPTFQPVADQKEAAQYVSQLRQYLKDGGEDVNTFIDNLKGMGQASKDALKLAIQQKADMAAVADAQKLIDDTRVRSADAVELLRESYERLAVDGMAKLDAGIVSNLRWIEKEESKYRAAATELEAYRKARYTLMTNVITTAANTTLADDAEKLRKAQDDQFNATASLEQQKQRAHEREMARINEQYNLRMSTLLAEFDLTKKTEEDYQRLDVAWMALLDSRAKAIARNNAEIDFKFKSDIQKLAEEWQKGTDMMSKATANWANQFVDYLANVTTGGSGMWKQMVRSMAMDLYKISLKNALGGTITSMFGSIGGQLSSAMGLGGGKGGPTGTTTDPINTVVLNNALGDAGKTPADAAKTMLTTAKEKLDGIWESLKGNLSSVYDSIKGTLGDVFSGLGDNLSGMMDWLSSGLSDMMSGLASALSSSGGEGGWVEAIASFFADGGVMTGAGPVSLRKYAMGGVANSPQLAMFGEGSTPEAYVPLPDGRSIPVKMLGGNSSTTTTTNGVVINIQVNKNSEDTKSQGDENGAWTRVAERVRNVVMEELVVQQRPGGVLYK